MQTDSGIYKLQMKDILKAFLIAFGTALFPSIYVLLSADHFPTWPEFQPYLLAALSSGFTYVAKNFFTNNAGQLLKKDEPLVTVPVAKLDTLVEEAKDKTVPLPYNKTNQ